MLNQKSNLKNQNHNSKVKNEFRERCYNYSITIIELIKDLPEKRVYWTLSDQLPRSATSIGGNIVEAKSASSKKDDIKYYEIALKYWLGLLRDALEANKNKINKLLRESAEIANILAASILTMKGKKQV